MDCIKVLKTGFGFTTQNKYFKVDTSQLNGVESLRLAMQLKLPVTISSKKYIYIEPCILHSKNGEKFIIGVIFDNLFDLAHLSITPITRWNMVDKLDRSDIDIFKVECLTPQEADSYKDLARKEKNRLSDSKNRKDNSEWHIEQYVIYSFFTRMEVGRKTVYEDIDDLNNDNCIEYYRYNGIVATSEKELAKLCGRYHEKSSVNHDHMQDIADSYDLLSD